MAKKRSLSLFLALVTCAFVLVVGLSGCGSSAPSSDTAGASSSFVGTWELATMDDTSEEELQTMKDLGYNMFFVFDESGSATYEFMGYAETGSYEVTGDTTATLSLEDDEDNWKPEMAIENGSLVVESVDSGVCTFKKISEEEHQAYNEEYDLSPETE